MNNYTITEVHISTIKKWDTVLCPDGYLRTVGGNIKRDDFFGHTLFGNSYKLGKTMVKKVTFTTQAD